MADRALGAIVLAAGAGKRIRTSDADVTPKVMKQACGVPLIGYVLRALKFIPAAATAVVVGYGRESVIAYCGPDYRFCVQEEQRGTGDAAMSARALFEGFEGDILVTAGDMPLVSERTYTRLFRAHREAENSCTVLSTLLDDPTGYGRVLRDGAGRFLAIREHKDCSAEERLCRECNTSIYIFDGAALFSALAEVTPANAQNEYYLTDVPHILKARGAKIGVFQAEDAWELVGVNDMAQLRAVEETILSKNLVRPEK
ncbi:NTP transferase domain-containing protein [Oscillospiraceae bacterium OttesenSCG-928-F05]|nr:NTP transferase domain-containing protein [Oscillospiraceae bacterium OttesenSCG-928-F05]